MLNMTDKKSYRPISTLSNFSKIFEKLIYIQINSFIDSKLSKYLAAFRKNHNTQHDLLNMTETWSSMLTTTFCNYADDNTMHSSDKNANIVIGRLRHDFAIISEWSYEYYMLLNADKCYFLTVSFNEHVDNVTEEKILGMVLMIRSILSFI